uniref:Uncharacterized protein n=1 Tax=Anguilla anguilla TaxID=7936 RepID=A0A0E9REA4_ANGAN
MYILETSATVVISNVGVVEKD